MEIVAKTVVLPAITVRLCINQTNNIENNAWVICLALSLLVWNVGADNYEYKSGSGDLPVGQP